MNTRSFAQILPALIGSTLASTVGAQQEVWRVWSSADAYGLPSAIGDFNADRVTDVLVLVSKDLYTLSTTNMVVRILSGVDGSILNERAVWSVAQGATPLGDVNGDGSAEYALWAAWSPPAPNTVEVRSVHASAPLWTAAGPFYGRFGLYTIGLNLDNDPNHEVITSTSAYNDSRIFAYDHNGTPLYTINLQPPSYEWLRGLGIVGDIDNDGATDFGVGLVEGTGRGAVQLYSGRTGAPIRRDLGPLVGDAIGSQVEPVGDFDRDGVPDYAVGSYLGYRGVAIIYSGATGQILREWSGEQGMAEKLVAGPDFDLDGVPDVLAGGPRHFNPTGWIGRVQVLSGRDGGLLWDEWNGQLAEPGTMHPPDRGLGQGLANLGPLPGGPYPVVVVWDWPWKIVGYIGTTPLILHSPRLRAFRVGLAGTAVRGSGCASVGSPPQIAVRRDAVGTRVTLSGARPNSFAWLLVGPLGATSWHGQPLPIGLDHLALPGCQLRVPADIIFSRITGSTGWDSGYALVTAPYTVSTVGLGVAGQWFTFDPSSLDFAMSPRHELWLQ